MDPIPSSDPALPTLIATYLARERGGAQRIGDLVPSPTRPCQRHGEKSPRLGLRDGSSAGLSSQSPSICERRLLIVSSSGTTATVD